MKNINFKFIIYHYIALNNLLHQSNTEIICIRIEILTNISYTENGIDSESLLR